MSVDRITAISEDEKDAIQKVVRGYYDAFGRVFAAASEFFGEPTLIVSPNQILMLSTCTDVEAVCGE